VFNITITIFNVLAGWTCSGDNLGDTSCVMQSGQTFDVVQWAPNAVPS